MGITQILFKLQNMLEAKQDAAFRIPVSKQKAYLTRFPEPKDDITRGYYQYRCQAMMRGRFLNSMISVASFPVTLLMMFKYRRANAPEKAESCENRAVLFRDGKPANIVPTVVRNEFSDFVEDPIEGNYLRKEDLAFLWELICRYPLSWQFALKCTIKVARYRYALEKYGPKALIVCNEYSFTSSVLTEFCTRNNVELVNVMHGDKGYNIRDSFFRFHRCYVWGENYVHLLEKMRAAKGQFHIEVPNSLRFSVEQKPEQSYDYTYYFGGEDKKEMEFVCKTLLTLREKGKRIKIRPHPRYTDMQALQNVCGDIPVESCAEVSIEMSVLQSKAVISQFSTVMLQAYYNGITVVLDDMTNPEQHAKLRELECPLLNLEHRLLSKEVEEAYA